MRDVASLEGNSGHAVTGSKVRSKVLHQIVLIVKRTMVWGGLFLVALVGALYATLRLSLPSAQDASVAGLSSPVSVGLDHFGVPVITADDRLDAFRALGHMNAKDRLFQMDLMRRRTAGRLAEIFGEGALAMDMEHRYFGFEGVAREVARRLPSAQLEALRAYANGVNSVIESMKVPPFEFLILGYRPERWRVEDSLLVVLNMFEMLSNTEAEERMLSIMEHSLPPSVYRFLTPETDRYTQAVIGERETKTADEGIPLDALSALLERPGKSASYQGHIVQSDFMLKGSNAWAVAGSKTWDGRAILANDMHLGISVPNTWYRCQLRYGNVDMGGVVLPGTPLIVAGATRQLAWGMTTLNADVFDLVKLEINPDNPNEYRTPEGWRAFDVRRETISVKGQAPREVDIKTTLWGPVSQKPLLEQPVAIHWTALDPDAVDVGLLDLDQAETLAQAVVVMNTTKGPPLNAILADHLGHVAWTTVGRLPIRKGFDGAVSRSWTNGNVGWEGFIPPEKLPRNIDPPQGFVVSANNRSVGKDYRYPIGHGYANGHRAYRIAEGLRARERVSEAEMFQLQLDSTVEGFDFYRHLALEVLSPKAIDEQPQRRELRDYLYAWDGRAEVGSLGYAVLLQFRRVLAESVFNPFLANCREQYYDFKYGWPFMDVPLQALLSKRDNRLLPERDRYANWDAFVLAKLEESAWAVMQEISVKSISELNWGKANTANYTHPLSSGIPGLGAILDLPHDPLAGCGGFCVRVTSPGGGASERLVISPGHPADGILHIPGGQSGHPLSPNYQDQYPYWLKGLPVGFVSGKAEHTLRLVPAKRVSE